MDRHAELGYHTTKRYAALNHAAGSRVYATAASHRLKETMEMAAKRITGKQRDAESTVYFDPASPIGRLKGNLPHWRQDGVTYFVTFRLNDSIPQTKLRQWLTERKQWLDNHAPPHDVATQREFNERFTQRFLQWLDAGHGECILRRSDVRELITDTLRHFDGQRYRLADWVIMPNHVHVLVSPLGDRKLSSILHSWKSFTAQTINRLLSRQKPVWQKESFDHIVRSAESFERIARYIQNNPKLLQPETFSLHKATKFP